MISQPTNLTGFAPRDFEPMYPSLHRGLVGAWSMGHGPTGSTLFDRSGFGSHGTLTNMDPATDWVVDGGRYALEFDGVNEVNCGNMNSMDGQSQLTMSGWFRRTSANDIVLFGKAAGTTSRITIDIWSDTRAYLTLANGGNTYGKVVINDALWHHIVSRFYGPGTGNSERLRCWIDGVEVALIYAGTIPSTTATNAADFKIGEAIGSFSDGLVDDLRIYNRSLTPNEIWTLSGFGGNQQVGRGIAYRGSRRRFVAPAEAAAATVTRTKKSQLVGADGAVTDLSQKRARIVGL